MDTNLTVKLSADTNYIPVMYRVVEMTTGSGAATTYCVLVVARVGWDTEAHYNDWKATSVYADSNMHLVGRNTTGIQGILGTLSVAALSAIEIYKPQTPSTDM